MPEWLYEDGIGEARAALVEDGRILEALIEPDDAGPRAGTVVEARLVEVIVPRLQGRIAFDGGEALLDGIPAGVSEGAMLTVRIVREAIPETGRAKLAKAVAAPDATPSPAPSLLERIEASGEAVRRLQSHDPDLLEDAGWSELLDEAIGGEIGFPGGVLRLSITPAMTLFDVDGQLPAPKLAIAGAGAAGSAIRRHGIGGSIGIDLPTISGKAGRQAVAAALDAALPQPFERTAMNGFGFIQLVRRRARPSLPELLRADLTGAALRAELRRIERSPPSGAVKLPERHLALLKPQWRDALARRLGREIAFEAL